MEHKFSKYDELEEAVEIYKQKYNESLEAADRMKSYDKEKNKMNRVIDEKDVIIKKMQ